MTCLHVHIKAVRQVFRHDRKGKCRKGINSGECLVEICAVSRDLADADARITNTSKPFSQHREAPIFHYFNGSFRDSLGPNSSLAMSIMDDDNFLIT
jgi:hypothetical protein